jgi:hypothetical protein
MKRPLRVKLFFAVFTKFANLFDDVRNILIEKFGDVDLESQPYLFDEFTNYYHKQMGKGLYKKFYSFKRLIYPDQIANIKIFTNKVENDFSKMQTDVLRPVNIDPGYVGFSKMVLASTKDNYHRIYLADGIFAEVTLRYVKGSFQPWEWTYPDYRTKENILFFNRVRNIYKNQIKNQFPKNMF